MVCVKEVTQQQLDRSILLLLINRLQDTCTSECMHDEFRCTHMSSRRHVRMHVVMHTLRGQSVERALVLIFTTEVGLGQKLALHIFCGDKA